MVPNNHPTYPFPYNLEDRIKHIINELELTDKDYLVKKSTKDNKHFYKMSFKKKLTESNVSFISKLGKLDKKELVLS